MGKIADNKGKIRGEEKILRTGAFHTGMFYPETINFYGR